MLIIHQPKSAGSAFRQTLSEAFELPIANGTNFDPQGLYGRSLHSKLEGFVSGDAPILSVHLHPTKKNMSWVKRNQVCCIILLRNPEASFSALSRHRKMDGSKGTMSLHRRPDPLGILKEFNRNWRTLVGLEHLLFVSHEMIIHDTSNVILEVAKLYDINTVNNSHNVTLKKVRFSGHKESGNKTSNTDLSLTKKPTFKFSRDSFWYQRVIKSLKHVLPKKMIEFARTVKHRQSRSKP